MPATNGVRDTLPHALREAFKHPHAVDVDQLADRLLRAIELVVGQHAQGPQHQGQEAGR